MTQERLWIELERVASRYRRLRYWSALAAAWGVAAMVAFLAWGLGRTAAGSLHLSAPLLCLIAVALAGLAVWMAATLAPRRTWVAQRVAAAFPELRNCLLAAVEQRPALPDGRFGFLQSSVIEEAVDHARQHPWQEVVPQRRISTAIAAQFAAFALFVAGLAATVFSTSPPAVAASADAPGRGASATGYSIAVEPGDVEIEKGTSLLVLARVTGQMPAEAALVYQSEGGEAVEVPMPLSLKDPVFGARIDIVNEPLDYHVDLDGRGTPAYHVKVFEYPRLERADARLVYPKYAGMEERLVQDVRTVTVVEGTEVTLICRLNKPVVTARLVESEKIPPLELAAADGEPNVYQTTFRPEKSRRLKLQLIDDAGRRNVQTAEVAIHVVPNQAPVLKPVFPARDMEVSALEELDLKFTAFDDFGLIRAGVTYGLAGQPPVDVVLAESAAARTRHELGHTIRLEELQAEPDQLLAYHFWSEDYAADGSVRRTSSDMYFAEVRPWEEIYRQGEQPAGGEQAERERQQRERQQGQGENAQRAEQLAKLQKDIINATWKLIRRETGPKPTNTFATDAEQVEQSQNSAREKAEGMAEKLQDSESLVHLAAVLDQMEKAASSLKTAHEEPSAAPLPQALAAEQGAYQSLLKLRAREFQVIRQQRQQSASSSSSQSPRSEQQRRQMEQLQLQNDENRYETQRMAQSQSPQERQEERETRQVLNRLNELARRQHDLNERLKDLQSALAEAATPQEREEARRQLQRLQEEQQQVLRDTEELQSRMETPENQERMAQERQQLEQTRDQVQRASESMQQERVSQAAASGTRAERDFEELRNEFRRRAAGRFGEEVRQMRDDARELDRREQDLAERLKQVASPDPAEKSLRDDGRRERIQQDLADQRKRLGDLTERMRQTIQDAEQTEPLLSDRLYDAARNAQNQNPDRALQAAEGSVRRGLSDDARQQEEIAGRGIRQLREGVERAAESVLGDETEALRRARDELRQLSDELNREIARNSPDGRQPGAEGEPTGRQEDRARNARAQRDQAGEEGAQPGERQGRGQRQTGERQTSRQRGEGDQPGDRQAAEDQSNERQTGDGQPGRGQRQGQRGEGQRGERRTTQQSGEGQPGERQTGERGQRGGRNGRGQPGDEQEGEQPADADATDRPQPNASSRAGQPPGQRAGQQGAGGQRGERQNGRRGQPGQEGEQPGDPQDQQADQAGQRGGPARPGAQRQTQRGGRQGGRRLNDPNGRGGFSPFDEFDPELAAPLTGGDFLDWSDRLRDVEEMVDDPELRAEAARIRDRARALRAEFKRHSVAPNWDLVKVKVAAPLAELRDRVSDELLRRTAKQALVPLDRDPVPPRYSEKTRRYYENLGERQMTWNVNLGAPQAIVWAALLAAIAVAALAWSYSRSGARSWVRLVAGFLKAAGMIILGLCLVDPVVTGTRPRPGSNLFLVVADNSVSLTLSDRRSRETRGEALRERLREKSAWLARLGQDFDVRRYLFDTNLRPVKTFDELTFDGEASAMSGSLAALVNRFRGQPVAGILLLTDGNATDLPEESRDWKQLPPVYSVAIGNETGLVDLSISRVAVTQTNFEAAPVTIAATIEGQALSGRPVVVRVLDDDKKEIERRVITDLADGQPSVQRFLLRPEHSGVSFYTVQAFLKGEEELADHPGRSDEATLANNSRIATVDRGGGPYRVLYVSGRPNWEFKFLRRAMDEDDEVKLVGLIRVARKEPKFTFLGQPGERTNPLFRGFGNQSDEQAEQYDQPVLIRLKIEDEGELRDGFPKSSEELFRYHAVILDDLEAAFFTQDQLSLLQQFVSRRGGGFLMLGGKDSFVDGKYQRTPVGEMLPVYLDRSPADMVADSFSLVLTREGWLQPWVRLRTNEQDEQKRFETMPEFKTLNPVETIKPGASILARVASPDGVSRPALVVQQFGRGRTGALLVGDLWRWNLHRTDHRQSDLEKSWRQTVRWLVSDVPARVEVETRRLPGSALPATQIVVKVRDAQFAPLDNAGVVLHVKTPDGREVELVAESSDRAPGQYEATFAPRESGVYRAQVSVTAADGSEVGRRETGWSVESQTEELRSLAVNRPLLAQIASDTGGEMVSADDLDDFVSSLPNRKIPITESWTYPLWHQWQVFLVAISCFVAEWALRRWKGLP